MFERLYMTGEVGWECNDLKGWGKLGGGVGEEEGEKD